MRLDLSGTTGLYEQKIIMNPGGIVRGVVVDQSGKPVEGVYVNTSIGPVRRRFARDKLVGR